MSPTVTDIDAPAGLADVDALLAFLPVLERDPSTLFHEDPSISMMDPFVFGPELSAFVQAAYAHGFVVPYDWSAWSSEMHARTADRSIIARDDLGNLRRILTGLIRADRFCSGTIAWALEDGTLLAVLRRLAALREEMSNSV